MRFKFTIFLLVANLLTFGLILYESGKGEAVGNAHTSFFSMGITKIEIPGTGTQKSYVLELRKKEWEVTSPYTWPANFFEVNALLNELHAFGSKGGFSLEEVESSGGSLADYGLDKSAPVLAVTDDSGTHELKIGRETPDKKGVYVYDAKRREIIPASIQLFDCLTQDMKSFRSEKIFSMEHFKVNSFSVRHDPKGGAEKRVGLSRIRDDAKDGDAAYLWRFDSPTIATTQTQEVEVKLKELTNLKYKNFYEENPTLLDESGLRSPKMRISLEGAMSSQVLLVGGPVPDTNNELYAKLENNNCIFTIDAKAVDFWNNPSNVLDELRDPHILRFDEALLKSVKIDDGEHTLMLHRTEPSADSPTAPAEKTKAVDDGEVDLKTTSESTLLSAIKEPVAPQQSGVNSNYDWQMPVAPGSHVKSVTAVDPCAIKNLVHELLNLKAQGVPLPADKEISGLHRNFFNKFVSDDVSKEDSEELGFDDYAFLVEIHLEAPDKKALPNETITLTIARPIAPGYPCHAKVGNAVYSISNKILDVLSVDPMKFRERSVYEIPADASWVSLKLVDISEPEEKVVLDKKCPEGTADWGKALAAENSRDAEELLALEKCVLYLEAEAFLPDAFSPDFRYDHLDSGESETWRYRLEVGVKTANAQTPETEIYYLTKRLGGTFQLAASPKQNCIFRMKQDFIDAMHKLTFARDSSKDVPEIPVPDAVEQAAPSTVPAKP